MIYIFSTTASKVFLVTPNRVKICLGNSIIVGIMVEWLLGGKFEALKCSKNALEKTKTFLSYY